MARLVYWRPEGEQEGEDIFEVVGRCAAEFVETFRWGSQDTSAPLLPFLEGQEGYTDLARRYIVTPQRGLLLTGYNVGADA